MEKSLIKRHESIIVSTHPDLKYSGASKSINKTDCKQEGVSEGTLFRHFKE